MKIMESLNIECDKHIVRQIETDDFKLPLNTQNAPSDPPSILTEIVAITNGAPLDESSHDSATKLNPLPIARDHPLKI